jgi:alpha-glucosidase (family GH31 glycosyl hydrolase)
MKQAHTAHRSEWYRSALISVLLLATGASAAPLEIDGIPVELAVRRATGRCLRITLQPLTAPAALPENPALMSLAPDEPALKLRQIDKPATVKIGDLVVTVHAEPLEVLVSDHGGAAIQKLTFDKAGSIRFLLDSQPVLGLGEGGPRPKNKQDWRTAQVEFDRRGRLHRMEPRWQADAYGSRNPVPLLVGTAGWALYFASPWGQLDLSHPDHGSFLPVERKDPAMMRQNHANQAKQLGKGVPPAESFPPGFRDVFVFDARDPRAFVKDLSTISGTAVLPPKWALGYMQSHRTLEDNSQMIGIVDTFREKKIPIDAVIYLGTGFTPRGWNKPQPSFEFNPEVFKQSPGKAIEALHDRHAKVVLHVVPWDRDRIPLLDTSRIRSYWKEHEALVNAGVDGWWPDEGDWFDLHERIKRHQLYYEGPISTQPDLRPWSLHRNGYLGVARWGGWVWSGDTDSTWKTLEAQIAVGINHSLSVSPYWGSDIGGFFPTTELSGELYARWFQFGAFCPSFRSHGRTWWTRLPWGWGLDTLGPEEHPQSPDKSSLKNPEIEKIARKYADLRYQLLSLNYTLAWEARDTGLPLIRSLWLHYPEDSVARSLGDQYLWGRDLLIAPVYEKGAKTRELYLPAGEWYDLWSGERQQGGRRILREVDLATMPIFVRAGAILPIDPIRQYSGEPVKEPLTIRVYPGADGQWQMYHDDGTSNAYLKGEASLTSFSWDDRTKKLTITPAVSPSHRLPYQGSLKVELIGGGESKSVDFQGEPVSVDF